MMTLRRHALMEMGWLAAALIEHAFVAKLLIAFANPTQMTVAKTENLGRLPPRDLLRHRPQNHFLYLHSPFHVGLRVAIHASHGLLPSTPAKRTYHVLSQPDSHVLPT